MSIKVYSDNASKQRAYRERKAYAEQLERDKHKIFLFFGFVVIYAVFLKVML